jgi:chromate transporter
MCAQRKMETDDGHCRQQLQLDRVGWGVIAGNTPAQSKEVDMPARQHADFTSNWKEIASGFLKLGATAYGGPAIMGLMQVEFQDKRQWVPKERFVEGLSLANLVPGATATQLGIFLGYVRGGWGGGVLAGLCFMLPAFCIMLALAMTYAYLGTTPIMRGGLYGLGPVVLGIFIVAVYRLSKAEVTTLSQLMIALTAAVATVFTPLGIAPILGLAAGVGLWLFHSRRVGLLSLLVLIACLAVMYIALGVPSSGVIPPMQANTAAHSADLPDIATFFFKVGALTFGGGLTMIALIQEQVVDQYHWLTHQEFINGLALGQFTPGPVLMVAAYVGYKVAGFGGAVVAAMASFLPSFIIMLLILPVFDRMRTLVWTRAAMRGVGPAVMGVLAVFLVRMTPHALPDPMAVVLLLGTLIALLAWRTSALKLMGAGTVVGVLRDHLRALPGVRALG